MDWARQHLTTTLSLLAGVLLVGGTILVIERAPASPGGARAWGTSGNSLQDPQAYTPNPVLSTTQPSYGGQSPNFLPLAPAQPLGGEVDSTTGSDTDLAALLAQLSSPPKASADATTSIDTSLVYDFIPSGLISTSTAGQKRTSQQQALYEYGNEIGSYIQSYETRSGNVPQILRDQIEDRSSAQKGQAVKDVGASLIYIGTQMDRMDRVPEGAEGMHAALAASYKEMGTKLQAVPDAQGDQAFIATIQAYDASADAYAGNFVALADYFALSQVKFSSEDPGSVFTFSGGGGL
jgi:hypothetical protein